MTEEDTFKALKKWTYEDALQFWSNLPGAKAGGEKLKEVTGWTWEGLNDEWHRRNAEWHRHLEIQHQK